MITEEKITTKKGEKEYELIYDKTVLCPGKVDTINFAIEDDNTPLLFMFVFSDSGDKYTTNYLDDTREEHKLKIDELTQELYPAENTKICPNLIYILNKWDADSYVEISEPVDYKDYKIMFRNQSTENRDQRLFYFSLLKEK